MKDYCLGDCENCWRKDCSCSCHEECDMSKLCRTYADISDNKREEADRIVYKTLMELKKL